MIISAGDDDWESRLSAAFKERIQFELHNTDKLNLTNAHLYKLITGWCLPQKYTPKVIGPSAIRFRPDEMPDEPSFWNTLTSETKPRPEA